MNCVLKLQGMMEFSNAGADWCKLDYLGGGFLLPASEKPKFDKGSAPTDVELGVQLMSMKGSVSVRVVNVLKVDYKK